MNPSDGSCLKETDLASILTMTGSLSLPQRRPPSRGHLRDDLQRESLPGSPGLPRDAARGVLWKHRKCFQSHPSPEQQGRVNPPRSG